VIALRVELVKLRTTRTVLWLLLAMLALVVLAVTLHGLGLATEDVSLQPTQIRIFIAGQNLGSVFAALVGAIAITSEYRHGTIRPTFLADPRRSTVILGKAAASSIVGFAFGLVATIAAAALTQGLLHARGVTVLLDHDDVVQGILGGAVDGAFWAVLGLGIGGLIRNQVGAIVGIFIWVQVIENLLIDSAPQLSSYLPGALAQAVAGSQEGVVATTPALGLLALYATFILAACVARTARTDVA
jgi:ABC-type transport system involved in multi-copper enzyme maturation permease subunit